MTYFSQHFFYISPPFFPPPLDVPFSAWPPTPLEMHAATQGLRYPTPYQCSPDIRQGGEGFAQLSPNATGDLREDVRAGNATRFLQEEYSVSVRGLPPIYGYALAFLVRSSRPCRNCPVGRRNEFSAQRFRRQRRLNLRRSSVARYPTISGRMDIGASLQVRFAQNFSASTRRRLLSPG